MKLIDTNRYFLKGTNDRFLHLASIQDGLQEYICLYDVHTTQMYIERITGGHMEFIEDDSLAAALEHFLRRHGVLDISNPTIPDSDWLRRGANK